MAVLAAAPLVMDVRPACGARGLALGADGAVADRVEDLATYRSHGGYAGRPDAAEVHLAVLRADLDGRGGAGFPMARKLAAVAAAPGPRVVVANGEEGEPASVKDRWLLRHRPHLVLDGLRLAARSVGADEAIVYVSDDLAADAIARATAELVDLPGETFAPLLVRTAPSYVAGEESAVVRFIDTGEAKPTLKPPRPYESGVHGSPTLVSNVESLARVALAVRPDIGVEAGRTLLATVADGEGASLLEVPVSATVGELAAARRDPHRPDPVALLMGGFAGGIWPVDLLDAPLDRLALRERGVVLGCGAVISVEADDCVVAAATDIASYLAASSSGQCGICVVGTGVVADQLTAVARGDGDGELIGKLTTRVSMMRGRGNCAMPDAVEVLVRTLLENFPGEVAAHLAGPCPTCAVRVPAVRTGATRFRVDLPSGTGASRHTDQPKE